MSTQNFLGSESQICQMQINHSRKVSPDSFIFNDSMEMEYTGRAVLVMTLFLLCKTFYVSGHTIRECNPSKCRGCGNFFFIFHLYMNYQALNYMENKTIKIIWIGDSSEKTKTLLSVFRQWMRT